MVLDPPQCLLHPVSFTTAERYTNLVYERFVPVIIDYDSMKVITVVWTSLVYPSTEQPTCKSIQNLCLPDFLKCAARWTHWVLLVIWASTVITESLINIELWWIMKITSLKTKYPLKIDGWKMKRPFKWSLFRGHSFIFGVLYVFVPFLKIQYKDPIINKAGHPSCHFWSLKTGEKPKGGVKPPPHTTWWIETPSLAAICIPGLDQWSCWD